MLFKSKFKADGSIQKYEDRLVQKGTHKKRVFIMKIHLLL